MVGRSGTTPERLKENGTLGLELVIVIEICLGMSCLRKRCFVDNVTARVSAHTCLSYLGSVRIQCWKGCKAMVGGMHETPLSRPMREETTTALSRMSWHSSMYSLTGMLEWISRPYWDVDMIHSPPWRFSHHLGEISFLAVPGGSAKPTQRNTN